MKTRNRQQAQVQAFMCRMGQAVPSEPQLPSDDVARLRVTLIDEEAREFAHALGTGNLPAAVDAIADLLYVTYGAACALGVDMTPIFAAVHRANMEKAGGPVREDGKRLKPDDWQAPNIAALLRAQGWEQTKR